MWAHCESVDIWNDFLKPCLMSLGTWTLKVDTRTFHKRIFTERNLDRS